MKPAYEEVEHTADLALRVRGRDLAELLVNAALGLSSLLGQTSISQTSEVFKTSEVSRFLGEQTHSIAVEAPDAEGLLVEWLSELLYLAERERFVGRTFALHSVSPTHLQATAQGTRVDALARHIKAVTYHQLAIVPVGDGLETTIVFDV